MHSHPTLLVWKINRDLQCFLEHHILAGVVQPHHNKVGMVIPFSSSRLNRREYVSMARTMSMHAEKGKHKEVGVRT